jgi:two-component system KDP operon response regulator KdpE
MTKPVVLVIEDEAPIRRFLRAAMELEGFEVLEADTASGGLKQVTMRPVDLVIVDLNLPDQDGSELVERIRGWSLVPLIVLSVRASEQEKVRLLELGADDYVVKPFGIAELIARARAALRRYVRGSSIEPVVIAGTIEIDLAARRVLRHGQPVPLSVKEYRLLHVLARHAGNVVTQQHLLREVWGPAHVEDTHYLRIFIRKLRQKIEEVPTRPTVLLTELGVGYRLASAR